MDCDVGTHSISPTTKMAITNRTVGTVAFTVSRRNGSPIISIATTSFGAAGTCSTRLVSRSCSSVTVNGLTITRKPHSAGENPYVSTSDTGSTTSNETYTNQANIPEARKSRNA